MRVLPSLSSSSPSSTGSGPQQSGNGEAAERRKSTSGGGGGGAAGDSPLDALFQMASKTFEGLKAKSGKKYLKSKKYRPKMVALPIFN